MNDQSINLRLQQLDEHLSKDLGLLKEIEDELRVEDHPIHRARYQRDIERLRESAAKYQREAVELKAQSESSMTTPRSESAEIQQQVEAKLDVLLTGINVIVTNQQLLSRQLQQAHQSLLNRLDQSQQETVNAISAAIDAGRLPETELRQLLDATQQSVAALQKCDADLPALREAAEVIRLGSETVIEAKHKLKLILPLIPLVLNYEGELELKGGMNLSSLWEAIVRKMKG